VSQPTKQDTHFINIFSLVIGVLAAIAIAIFALARNVASHTQEQQVLVEAQYLKSVNGRIQPFSHEAVAGQDNSQLAIKADNAAAATGAIAGAVFVLGRRALVDLGAALIALVTWFLFTRFKKLPEPAVILGAGIVGLLMRWR